MPVPYKQHHRGHEKVVQMLLDRGADVDAKEESMECPTSSIRGGHEKVVQMLLDRGADVNAQGGEYGNALQAASVGGHDKVVQMLLDRGADVNAQGGDMQCPTSSIRWSREGGADATRSRGGRQCSRRRIWQCPTSSISRWSRDGGADATRSRGGRQCSRRIYGNALQAASEVVTRRWCRCCSIEGRTSMLKEEIWQCPTSSITGGHDKVVQILLDRGADVNAQGGFYGNALQAASAVVTRRWCRCCSIEGRTSMLKEENMAMPYKQHHRVVTIWWCRCYSIEGRTSMLKENMAMPYKQHQQVVTIWWCRYYSIEGRTSMLKEENMTMPYKQHHRWSRYGGADTTRPRGGRQCSRRIIWQCPTSSISIWPRKMVQMLLDKRADVNAQGGLYGNALQAASRLGHRKVAQILLDRGAGPTINTSLRWLWS